MLAEIPAVVGGCLQRVIRDERHLLRLCAGAKIEEFLRRISFDIEFGLREFVNIKSVAVA